MNGMERALDGRPRVGGIHRSRRRWIILQRDICEDVRHEENDPHFTCETLSFVVT